LIQKKREEGALVLTVLRSFMADRGTETFEAAYRPLVATEKKLVMDLSELDYIDSSHLATLVVFYKRVVQSGGNVVFTGLRHTVRDALQVTRLDKVFVLAASTKDALELLENLPPNEVATGH